MSEKDKNNEDIPAQAEEFRLGAWLKLQRTHRNISLEEIAAVTKVHIHQLETIEADKWSEMPAPAFVRGFLVCYSRHLDLDEDYILKRFKETMGPGFKTIEASLPSGASGVQSATKPNVRVASSPNFRKSPGATNMDIKTTPLLSLKKLGVVAILIIAIVLLITLVSVGKKEQTQEQEKQALELGHLEENKEAPLGEEAKKATISEIENKDTTDTKAVLPPPQNVLVVYGIESTWIKAKIDDENSKGASLEKGQNQTFNVRNKVRLVLSNAGAVELKWNGVHYASPGFRGDVKTITLPDQLSILEKKVWPKKVIPKPSPNASQLPGSAPVLPGTSTEE